MIASVQHSLGLLIWGCPRKYLPCPILMEVMGVLYGGGWGKEGG